MANRRMIASDIWLDDFFMDLSFLGRLLWIGLVTTCADDQGRLRNHPRLIRSELFPLDDIPVEEIEALLQEFARSGRVVLYQADGKDLLQIVNWWKYQTPSWASPSKYLPPPGWIDREKYHTTGSRVESRNWELKGGFQAAGTGSAGAGSKTIGDLPAHTPGDRPVGGDQPGCATGSELPRAPGNSLTGAAPAALQGDLHSHLRSHLHSPQDSGVGRAIEEGKVKDEGEGEGEAVPPASSFYVLKQAVEDITGLEVEGAESRTVVDELAAMGALPQDIRGGYDWLVKKGRILIHPRQLIGPTRTEVARRQQGCSDSPPRVKIYTGPYGEKVAVPG